MPQKIDSQLLQEYVATATSGKYKTWEDVDAKFPELKGYDSKLLQSYVATATSGKYKTWEEIDSKFPEFYPQEQVKKKEPSQNMQKPDAFLGAMAQNRSMGSGGGGSQQVLQPPTQSSVEKQQEPKFELEYGSGFKQAQGAEQLVPKKDKTPIEQSEVAEYIAEQDFKKAEKYKNSHKKLQAVSPYSEGYDISSTPQEEAAVQQKVIGIEQANQSASELVGKPVKVFNDDGTETDIKPIVDDLAKYKEWQYNTILNDKAIYQAKEQADETEVFKTTKAFASTFGKFAENLALDVSEFAIRGLSDFGLVDAEIVKRGAAMVDFEQNVRGYRDKMLRGVDPEVVDKGFTELLAEGDVINATKTLFSDAIDQTPQLALMLMSGGTSGMKVLAGQSGLSHYNSISDRPDLTVAEKLGQSIALGAAEYISEKIFQTDLKMWSKAIGSGTAKDLAKGIFEEGFEESSVALLEQLINYSNNGDFNIYAIADAFSVGGAMGGAPSIASHGVSALGSNNNLKKKSELSSIYRQLNKELIQNDKLNPNEKIELRNQIKSVISEYNDIVKKDEQLYKNMEQKDVVQVVKINQEIAKLKDLQSKTKNGIVKQNAISKIKILAEEKQAIEQKYAEAYKTPEKTETTPENIQSNQEVTNQVVTKDSEDLSQKPTTISTEKTEGASRKIANNQPINEVELADALDEAYYALDAINKDNTMSQEDKDVMSELIEDEIQKLESYDNITTTETRKVAEERTVRTVKKTPRKTIPSREKDFVGKKATYSDNKGGGGSGIVTVVEAANGKEYYVLEAPQRPVYETIGASTELSPKKKGKQQTATSTRKVVKVDELGQKFVIGEVSKTFKEATVNKDKNGVPVSVTMPVGKDGKQITIKDAKIAQEFDLEQGKQEEFDEQIFEETYIEFVGEENIEVLKPKVSPKPDKNTAKVSVEPDVKTPQGTSTQQSTQEVAGKKSPVFEAKNLTNEPPTAKEEKAAEKVGITPKNLRDLYAINRDMFGQNKVKAFASAVIMDKMIGAMAKRAGVTKQEMYGKISFKKGSVAPKGSLKQDKKITLYHSTTSPIIGNFRVSNRYGFYGIYFAKSKSKSKTFGDITYKVSVNPKNTLVINDNEVKKYNFFNISKESYDKYISDGYDSIAWYKNGVLQEFVVLDNKIISNSSALYQNNQGAMLAEDGNYVIYALTDPNVSTPLHELAHVFEHYLTEAQKASVLKWAGATEWTVDVSERFARGFEKYLADGKAPTVSMQKIFDRFKEWLTDIYNGITGSEIDVELNDEMKALYGKMLGVDEVSKKKDEEVAVSEKKAKETAKALKEGFKLWLSQQKQSNIIFDPRSKAAQDMALTRLIINHAVAVGADTVQKIKDIIDNMTNGSLELTRDGAEYIIDLAFPSHNKTRSRILGFATKAINSALNAKEGIESNITNAMVISKEMAKEVDKQRDKAVSEYAKNNSIKKDEARKEVNRLMNNLLAPEENNKTSHDAFLELELVSPSLANSVQAMRNQIDAVTKSILEDPAFLNLSPALRKKMEENLGNYTHREYLFFSSKNKNKELRRIANKLQINKDLEEIGFWNPSERLIDDAAKQYAIEHADPSSGMPMSYDDALDAINALIDDWKAARDPLYTEQAGVISSADLKLRSGALKKKTKLAIDQALWLQAKKEAKRLNPNAKTTVVLAKAAEIYESLGGEWSDMPEYLRNLLGEIKDPVSRYINTITAMSAVLYKGKAMKDIIDNYSGFGWVSTKEPRTDKKDFILVDDKFSPLDGMWVHKNIINEFNQKAIYQTDYAVANAYFTVQNWFRRTKILPNPATWFKNVVGGYYGQVLNGEFYGLTNPSVAAKSLWGRLTEMTAGQRTEFMKGVFDDAAEAGVLSSGVDVAVMGYLDDMFISIENRDFSQFEKSLSKLYHKSVNKVKSVSKEAGRRYSQVDDHSKAILVYSQKYDVANQIFDKDYDSLTDEERTEVLKETGNMVKKTMPTFSRLPSWFRTMSRIPFFGDFLSFKIEAIRSFAGAVSVALEHGANAALPMIDPRTEKEYTTSQKIAFGKSAAKRFAGITAIAALNYAVIRGLFDSDDDEEEKLAAERKLLKEQAMLNTPEWTVGKSLIYKGVDKNGNVKFLDYSGQDPYSDVITLAMGNTKSLSDIFKPSLTMQAFSDVWNGESGDWRLYWETDPWITKAAKSSLYLSENLVPPFISSSKYELDKKRKEQEDYANFSKRGFTGAMGDYASVVAPRITVRDYSYNVYSAAKNFAYKINKDYNVSDIKKVKTEKELYQRIANLKKMRDNYKLVMLHVSAYPDSYPKKDLELVVKAMKSGLNFSGTKKESYGEKNFLFNTNDESAQKILDFWLEEENVKRRLELNNKPKK